MRLVTLALSSVAIIISIIAVCHPISVILVNDNDDSSSIPEILERTTVDSNTNRTNGSEQHCNKDESTKDADYATTDPVEVPPLPETETCPSCTVPD
jgi:hypothetical protein